MIPYISREIGHKEVRVYEDGTVEFWETGRCFRLSEVEAIGFITWTARTLQLMNPIPSREETPK